MAEFYNSNAIENQRTSKNPFQKEREQVQAQQQERLANRDKYGVELTDNQYSKINNFIAQSENPEEESYKIASSLKLSENLGLPFLDVYSNLDTYLAEFEKPLKDTRYKNGFNAIGDMFQLGKNNNRIGELGNLIMKATSSGDNESIEIYRKEYEQLKKNNELLQDNAPRHWTTKALESAAQSAPFTGAVGAAALFGNFILPGAGGFIATTVKSAELTAGMEYLSMIDEGIDHDTAYKVSRASGLLQGLVEASLDTITAHIGDVFVSGIGKAAGSAVGKSLRTQAIERVTNSLQKKFHFGPGKKIALNLISDYISAFPSEMAEEASQSLIEDVAHNFAARTHNTKVMQDLEELKGVITDELYNELKKENLIDEKDLREIVSDQWESAKGAFFATLVMGIGSVGIGGVYNLSEYKNLQTAAESIPSFEAFKKEAKDSPVFENYKDESKKNAAMREVWENAQAKRDKKDAEIIANTKETTAYDNNMEEAPEENEEGESETIPAYRNDEGRLYTHNEIKEAEEGENGQKIQFTVGNPEASNKNLYGYINGILDKDNNTVTITDFKMTSYRRGLTQEVFDEFAQEYAGVNIEWNPTSRAGQELKDLLIKNNFSGRNNGLNYYTSDNLIEAKTRRDVSRQIKKAIPNMTNEQTAAAVALLETGARRQGKSLSEYIKETYAGDVIKSVSEYKDKKGLLFEFINSEYQQYSETMKKNGKEALPLKQFMQNIYGKNDITQFTEEEVNNILRKSMKGFAEYGNQIKAVIYAGERADFSTFAHEVAHIWQSQLTGDLKEQAEKAFNVKNGDWLNSTFTFADGHVESSSEAFARGFEQYLETGIAPNEELKTLFQKFAEFLHDVYKTLKQFINMSPEIEDVYKQLMGADDSVMKMAEKAVTQNDRETYAKVKAEQEAAKETEIKAQEEQKKAEAEAKQDQKNEESEITLSDEKIAEPDFSEEEFDDTQADLSKDEKEIEGDEEESTHYDIFQKVEKTLTENGIENASEIVDTLSDPDETYGAKIETATDTAGKIRAFQIIGEKGAAALDKAEEVTIRLDNLATAKEMEKAGKDAKAIRYATGWEKGTDKLWRYEIADDYHLKNIRATNAKIEKYEKQIKKAKKDYEYLTGLTEEEKEKKRRMIADMVKHNALPEGTTLESMIEESENELHVAEMLMEYDTSLDVEQALKRLIERGIDPTDFWADMGESFYLSDLIDNPELFNAYPTLKKITIAFSRKDVDNHMGGYNSEEKSITIYPAAAKRYGDFLSVLAHEVQHAIQRIEGFAVGGSQEQFKISEKPSNIQEAIMLLDDIPMNELMNYKEHEEYKFIQEYLPEALEKNIDGLGTLTQIMDRWIEDVKNGTQTIENVYNEIQNARKAYNKYNRLGEFENEKTPFEKYQSIAGEVEARNVQTRINFTPEERLNTLLSETADVAPEDQIVLFEGLEANENNLQFQTITDEELKEVILNTKHTEETIQYKKTYYDEVKENYTMKEYRTSEGKILNIEGPIRRKAKQHEIDEAYYLQQKGYKVAFLDEPSVKGGHPDLLINDEIIVELKEITGNTNTAAKKIREAMNKNGVEVPIIFFMEEAVNNSNENIVELLNRDKYIKNYLDNIIIIRDYKEISVLNKKAPGTTYAEAQRTYNIQQSNEAVNNLSFQKVYHGSGANFDKFDTEEYGLSGEGSMSFGYGTYVTDSEEIARDYADRAKQRSVNIAKRKANYNEIERNQTKIKEYLSKIEDLKKEESSISKEMEAIREELKKQDRNSPDFDDGNIFGLREILKELKAKYNQKSDLRQKVEKKLEEEKRKEQILQKKKKQLENVSSANRNLYTVEIPDDGYLEWDKPVTQEQLNLIAKYYADFMTDAMSKGDFAEEWTNFTPEQKEAYYNQQKSEIENILKYHDSYTGGDLYYSIYHSMPRSLYPNVEAAKKAASKLLFKAGYTGIKYPAGTIHGNGNGAFNYVIFNDEDAEIVKHLVFQTQEELFNDARQYDNWQDFMEFYEAFGKPEVSLVPEGADAAWYKATWEMAKGIYEERQRAEELEKDDDSQSERIKDALFATKIEQSGELEKFLEEINYINNFDFKEAGAYVDEEEAQEYAKIERLKDYIHNKLRHGAWISNATRVANGKPLTPSTRKRLINLINLAAREYRDVYTEITGDKEFAVKPGESYFSSEIEPKAKKLNRLLTPEEALTMSPEQLRQLADSLSDELSNKEIAAKIKNGSLRMDDELKNYITKLDRRVKLAEERYNKLEKETKADYRHILDDTQRKLLDTYEELLRARAKLNNRKNLLDKKITKGLKITEKYKRDISTARANYDEVFKAWSNLTAVNKISAEVQEAMKRKEEYIAAVEETAKLKNDKAILTQISDMRKKLVKSAMRRIPFERINYTQAKSLIAIQRIFYPNLIGDVNKWIGEKPIYLKGIIAEYLTNSERKEEIDKMLSRKRAFSKSDGIKNKIEALQILLSKTKSSNEIDTWTTKQQNLLMRFIPQSDWAKDLNLEALEKERKDTIQLDIDEEGYTDLITVKDANGRVKQDKNGKPKKMIKYRPKFSEEIGNMVRDALGINLYNQLVNKPFEDWTTSEMESFTKRIDEIYREGRDELQAKRDAQKKEINEIRDQIRNAVRDTGIEINDDDTPEEKEKKIAKINKILGNDSTIKGSFAGKKEKKQGRIGKLLHGYNDMNVRRFARMLDGYSEGTNTEELYFKENDCYINKMEMLNKRNAKISAVLKENEIDLQELYNTIEVDGNAYSIDDLLYIIAADKDYELTTNAKGELINDDYAPTARNAVMFGNLGSSNELLEEKEELQKLDEETKERLKNGELTEEEQKTIDDGYSITSIPGTQNYIAKCHVKYDSVLAAAKKFVSENPKFEKLLEAIDEDYTEQFERLRQVSIEEFNSDVFRVKKYVPLYRMESNGDTNENRVREDLLATSGASVAKNYVNKGMTQKRRNIGPLNQKPVEMGLYKTWADATERTEHFINYAAYVRELNRVYKSRDAQYVRRFIENRYGKGAVEYIDNYIAEVANPNATNAMGALDQIVHTLRGKTASAYLAWKASAIIKQAATSPMPYMQFVSPAEYLKASFDCISSKGKLYDDIKEKSVYMANRVMDPVMDLIKEQQEKATNPAASALNKFNTIGMQGLEWIDWVCVAPGWLACYRQKYNLLQKSNNIELIEAEVREENERLDPSNPDRMTNDQIKAEAESRLMDEDEIERQAVLYADDCTRLSQPSNRKVDLAPLFKQGGEIAKAFLQFQTSLNVIWQNIRYDLPYAVRQKKFQQVTGMLLGYIFAGILVNAITEGFKPEKDDEKKKAAALRKFMYYSTTQFTDAIPVIGSLVTNLDNKLITGDKGFTSSSEDLIPMFTKVVKGTESLSKGSWDKALKNYAEAAGLYTGLPVSGTKELLRIAGIGDNEKGLDFKPESILGRRD